MNVIIRNIMRLHLMTSNNTTRMELSMTVTEMAIASMHWSMNEVIECLFMTH